jgi:hypothetical protein
MTFELSAEQLTLRDRARAFADTLRARAADIDHDGVVADDFVREARALYADDLLSLAVAIEEIAAANPAVAIAAAARKGSTRPIGLSGLRGALALDNSLHAQLVLAAVALGIGRSARDAALALCRSNSTLVSDAGVEKPHWAIADAATELEAARLLTYKAARTTSEVDIALARLMANVAAGRAVDAALRIGGAEALKEGSVIERLSRDVRAIALVLGTEEDQRSVAAEGLLPS